MLRVSLSALLLSIAFAYTHDQAVIGVPSQWISNPWSWLSSYSDPKQSDTVSKYIDLSASLSSNARIYERDSQGYKDLTLRWQTYRKPDFDVVVAVAEENDVAKTIKYANKHDLPFLAVTSGHGVTDAMGKITNGIQISMRKLNEVKISQDGQSVSIGGGALAFEVTRELWKERKQTVVPVAECIGMVGPALGGGHGFFQGQHGLMTDQIISARIVLGNGTIVTASENSNPDLFWALRGAGHNFGIITQLTYKVYDVPPGDKWASESFIFSSDQIEEIYKFANDLLETQPPKMTHFSYYVNMPDIDADKPVVLVITILNGPSSELAIHTAPLLALKPLVSSTTEVEHPDTPSFLFVKMKDLLCQKRSDTHASINFPIDLYKYNVTAMRRMYDVFRQGMVDEPRLNGTVMLIEGFSVQGVQAVEEESTAVPFRKKRLLLSPATIFPDNGDTALQEKAVEWGKQIREVLREGSGEHEKNNMLSYVNYALGDEGPKVLYGHKNWRQKKLIALKRAWDPQNRFSAFGPLVLEYS